MAGYDLDQADKIFICYTSDFGKIEIIARGVKKASSRLAAHLETFTLSDYLIILSAKNNILRSCFSIENFTNLSRNLDLYFAASYLLEATDKSTPLNDPEPRIFSLLAESLNRLNRIKNKKEIGFIVSRFQIKFLDISGLKPCFDRCALCGGQEIENMFFSFKRGGAVCGNCKKREEESMRITFETAKAAENILRDFDSAEAGKTDFLRGAGRDLQKIGNFLISWNLGKKIKAEKFINF